MHYALIPAGGRGTRLWPLSRGAATADSKPFLPLIGGRSLLELAWRRLDGVVEPDRRLICAAAAARGVVRRILPELPTTGWLGEPCGRDTLAAVALGCAVAERRDPDAVVAMIPADLFFAPDPLFRQTLRAAFEAVERCPGRLLTLGVRPTGPATGYGYLEPGEPLDEPRPATSDSPTVGGVRRLVQFREKPDAAAAETFVQDGLLWNAGVLVTGAAAFGEYVRRYEPEVCERIARIADVWETPRRAAAMAEHYPPLKRISVDHAILNRVAAPDGPMAVLELPATLRWSDIGSWNATELFEPDAPNTGVTFVGARDCAVFVDPRGRRPMRVRMIGTDRIIVVVTDEIVLVASRDAAQRVRELADRRGRLARRSLHGHAGFVGCGDCRIALDGFGRRLFALGLDGVRIVATRDSLTLIAGDAPAVRPTKTRPPRSSHRWKTTEWIPINAPAEREPGIDALNETR